MDRNLRTLPARATAQACLIGGIILALIGIVVTVLALTSPTPLTVGRGYSLALVTGLLALTGIAMVVGGRILLGRVRARDQVRAAAQVARR